MTDPNLSVLPESEIPGTLEETITEEDVAGIVVGGEALPLGDPLGDTPID